MYVLFLLAEGRAREASQCGAGPAPAVVVLRVPRLREAAPTRDGCRFERGGRRPQIPSVLYYDRALLRQLRRKRR